MKKTMISVLLAIFVAILISPMVLANQPVVTVIPDQTAVETQELSYTLVVTDAGHAQDQLSVSVADSTLRWLGIDINNALRLVGTPQAANFGDNEITIVVTDGQTPSEVVTFHINVLPALELSNVKVTTDTVSNVARDGKTAATYFQPTTENMRVAFTIKNNLDHAVTGINADLTSDNIEFQSVQQLNLNAGENKQVTLTETLPYTLIENEYPLTLNVAGRDYNDPTLAQKNSFPFILDLKQLPAATFITNATLGENTLSCQASTQLTIDYTNYGSSNEDDVIIKVTGGKNLNIVSDKFLLPQNTRRTGVTAYIVDIPAVNLSTGSNTINIELSYRDNFKTAPVLTKTITKNNCLTNPQPSAATLTLGQNVHVNLATSIGDESYVDELIWSVNDVIIPEASGKTNYDFASARAGTYLVKVKINGNEQEPGLTWQVKVVGAPTATNFVASGFSPDATAIELAQVNNFAVENNYGKIVFNQAVDLRNIFDLDPVITLSGNALGVDSATVPNLNKPATITIKSAFTNPVIQRATNFQNPQFSTCPTAVCQVRSRTANEFVFSVTGFSLYRVIELLPNDLSISGVLFDRIETGKAVNTTFLLRNTGANALTGLRAEITADAKYQLAVPSLPATLNPGEEVRVELRANVPTGEISGRHSIGTLKIISTEIPAGKTASIEINPQGFLLVDSIKVNDKSSGDLLLNEINKIKVTIKNDYTQDMENVEVKAKLINVDGDDLEEEADSFDLDKNDDKEITFEFDLTTEHLDEESYTLKIIAEGDAVDDESVHTVIETRELTVKRESHQLVIKEATLTPASLKCSSSASLLVNVENVGKNDEDDVKIKVKNSELGFDLTSVVFDLDQFSGSDYEQTETFNLRTNWEDLAPGSYPLKIEVYRDGSLEASKEVTLIIESADSCAVGATAKSKVQVETQLAGSELAQQLQEQLQARQQNQQEQNVLRTSFRDDSNYLLLLGTLIAMVLIAMVLGLAVLVIKKK